MRSPTPVFGKMAYAFPELLQCGVDSGSGLYIIALMSVFCFLDTKRSDLISSLFRKFIKTTVFMNFSLPIESYSIYGTKNWSI